jgi:HEPN domain-containing protein
MIPVPDLRELAHARLKDAKAMLGARRFDGAIYIVGYAVEMALKARICRTLKWAAFPDTRKEFESFTSFRTHDLDVLLRLSGREVAIRAKCLDQWSIISSWNPELRYRKPGTATQAYGASMVYSAEKLLRAL